VNTVWSPEAEQDRAAIWDFSKPATPPPLRMDRLFSDAVAELADFPMLGHAGEIVGMRNLTPHRSFRFIYEVVDDTVWIWS